ncbi:MAG: hypothetical protein ACE3JK_05650 [Sporolactobacillus sp.]
MITIGIQLLLCYGTIGLIMAGLLGALPLRRIWGIKSIFFLLFIMAAWFPMAVLALLAAPLANLFNVPEQIETEVSEG